LFGSRDGNVRTKNHPGPGLREFKGRSSSPGAPPPDVCFEETGLPSPYVPLKSSALLDAEPRAAWLIDG